MSSFSGNAVVFEGVPNDILVCRSSNGYQLGCSFLAYKIEGDEIKRIRLSPTSYDPEYIDMFEATDKAFSDKVSQCFGVEAYFSPCTGITMSKSKNEYYLTTEVRTGEDPVCCPGMIIQYKTRDFIKFEPVKAKPGINQVDPKQVKFIMGLRKESLLNCL